MTNHQIIIQKRKLSSDAGASTIVVVSVMAVIMALSLGLLLTASVLMRTSGRTLATEQCRIMAVSFGDEVKSMLTADRYNYQDRLEEETGRAENVSEMSVWHYVRQNIKDGSWPYLEEGGDSVHSRANAIRSFQMEGTGTIGEIADITLSLYWKRAQNSPEPAQLVVEVMVTVKGQSCSIVDVYELERDEMGSYDKWIWKHAERK